MTTQRNVFFISHGGGPLPLLNDPGHAEMVTSLRKLADNIKKPSAILLISAHWEEDIPTITSGESPDLIYDYYGFPEESYSIRYPALGQQELANAVHDCLEKAGIDSKLDKQRGFDHGMFIPLKIMYPEADIPCVQLSLVNSLDASVHLDIGMALGSLEWENLLVIGSGFSFHNLPAFFDSSQNEISQKNVEFESWLKETLSTPDIQESDRHDYLRNWNQAPHALFCHPREEHLLPLHICYAMENRPSDEILSLNIMQKLSSMYA